MEFERVPAAAEAVGEGVLRAAIQVHRELGPGLLERMYRDALLLELTDAGWRVAPEVALPVTYRGHTLRGTYRADLIVEGHVLVEVKAVETVIPIHLAQLQTYMRLTGVPLGFVLNFCSPRMVDGIHRRIRTPRAQTDRP